MFIVETYKKNKLWRIRPLGVWLYWRYLTLSQKVPQKRLLSRPKTFFIENQPNPVADIVFDLRNEFHANRMKFGIWGTKRFLRQFWTILTPLVLKVENFGQNKSSRAEKLATSLFLYGESEKIGPETICRPPDSSSGGFCWHVS